MRAGRYAGREGHAVNDTLITRSALGDRSRRIAALGAARYWLTGAVYLLAYVALDWISTRFEFAALGITPWDPASALSAALLLRYTPVYAPWLFAASLAAEIVVRGIPSWSYALGAALVFTAGYAFAAMAVLRWPTRLLPLLRLQDVVTFLTVWGTAVAIVAGLQAFAAVFAAQVAAGDFANFAVRRWTGDFSSILVLTPLLLRLDPWPRLRMHLGPGDFEIGVQIVALCVALWIVFGLETTDEFKFFFLTLIPIIWIAVRHGLVGACLASLGGQVGMLLLTGARGFDPTTVTEFQLLMLLIAAVGVAVGAVADEREAASRSLRAQQAALTQFSRISVAGEMVSALAHELSQPLAAAQTYLAETRRLVQRGAPAAELADSVDQATRQTKRASDVVARLRGFLYRGEMIVTPTTAQALIADSLALVRTDVALNRVEISSTLESQPAAIRIDAVQMQQVIINAIRNAIEAMTEAAVQRRRIDIVQRTIGQTIQIAIADSGPGLETEIADRAFDPFVTTKAGGMGLGLAISRSIVEAHGGSLRFGPVEAGAVLVITLPKADHAHV